MDAPARRDFSRARIRSHLEAWVLSHAPDSDEVRRHKQRMIGAMRGTVVELGPGPGSNMPYYAEGVRVIAIEPNPVMHDPLRRAAEQHGVQLEIRRVHAEDVGVGDGATGAGGIGAGGVGAGGVGAGGVGAGGVGAGGVGAGGVGAGGVGAGGVGAGEADGVVGTLVLCGVDDPGLVLQQVRRMLEPGGTYVFFEHVRAPEGSWTRRVQRLVRRPHAWLANGCRVDQDTAALLRDAGFSDVQIEGWDGGLGMGWTRTTIIGHAIR